MFIAKNCKFCKIHKPALVGGICITKKYKKKCEFGNDLTKIAKLAKNRKFCQFCKIRKLALAGGLA